MRTGYTEENIVITDILANAEVITLALTDEAGPYSVPVNGAYEGNILYIHSGKKGRKVACLDSGNKVAFSAAIDVRMREGGDNACDQGYLFRSVFGCGTPRLVEGDEKITAFKMLAKKHLDEDLPLKEKAIPNTLVYAIDVETISARVKE